jgi:hypothetical protein
MTTVAEIEKAVTQLPKQDREHLLRVIAASLDAEEPQMPPPRDFSVDQINQWIDKDEQAMRRFKDGK